MLHLDDGVLLVVFHHTATQHVFVAKVLKPEQRSCFMSADVAHIIGTIASHGNLLGVCIFFNIYFIKGIVAVIFHAKDDGAHELVMFHHFHETGKMNFFTPANHLFSAVVVNMFDDVRKCPAL
jgi:hypothetical protein